MSNRQPDQKVERQAEFPAAKLEHPQLSPDICQAIIQNAHELILIAQGDRLKFFNPKIVELLGYTAEELRKISFPSIIHPEDRELALTRYQRRLAGLQSPTHYPFRLIHKNGYVKWVEINAVLIEWENQPATLNFLTDITRRMAAGDALQNNARLMERTLESLQDALFIVDADTVRIVDCNPAAVSIFGYTTEEMIGQSPEILYATPEDRARLKAVVDNAIREKGFLHQYEFYMRRKDGTIFPSEHSVMPLGNNDSQNAGWVHLIRDISLRKKAVQSLQQSEERYRQFVENASDIIYRTDDKGIITFVNSVAVQISGYTENELVGHHYLEFVRPDRRFQTQRLYLRQYLKKITASYHEVPLLKRDGSEIWLGQNITLIIKDGKYIGFQAIARDISERMEAAQKLNASLKEKEILLKEIHHRVKNNLQIISSLLYLQSRYINDPAIQETFRESQQRIKSMAMIHEKLYRSENFSKINFADYIESIAQGLLKTYRTSGTRINLNIKLEPIYVALDMAIPCGLILNELLTNSLKHAFTNQERGQISLAFRRNGNQRVHLEVADDGCGFPDGLDYRQTNSLGMQLVNNLVLQIKGSLKMETENGTKWKLEFPPENGETSNEFE